MDLLPQVPPEAIHDPVPSPERRLLIAILIRSILDYLDDTAVPYQQNPSGSNCTKARARWEAEQFFYPPPIDLIDFDPNEPPPFSFPWIAEHLSNEPQSFMKRIRNFLQTAPKRSTVIAEFGRYAPGRLTY